MGPGSLSESGLSHSSRPSFSTAPVTNLLARSTTRTTEAVRRPSSQGVSGVGRGLDLVPVQAPPVALGGMK